MNKVLIDTNVWVDIALNRDRFFDYSHAAILACIEDNIAMLIVGTSLKDVFYWKEKAYDADAAYLAVEKVMELADVAQVDAVVCREALRMERPDYEGGIVAACALAEHCDAIITRDEKSFGDLPILKYSPAEFLAALGYGSIDF